MFENKMTHNGIHYTRYIVSWKKAGGKIYRGGLFERWLREQEKLTEKEISDILLIAENGKLELEESAKRFIVYGPNSETNREERKVANLGGYFDECTGNHFNGIKRLADKALSKFK